LVVIRLARMGKTHKPFYRITVADSRAAATGKFLEQIGHYDPNQNPPDIKVNAESALKWIKNGAQPSDTVRTLFYRQGLLEQATNARTGKTSDVKTRESYQAKKPKVHKKAKEKAEANAKAAAAAKAAEEKAAEEAKAAEAAAAAEAKAAAEAAASAAAEAPAEAAAEEPAA
jgi:small subunit ribosomal protein S16